jgi:hypothetical protein
MCYATTFLAAIVLAACCVSGSLAQSAQAVQAAHDATLKAQAITYTLHDASGATYGTAQLTTIGRTRTRIHLNFTSATTPDSLQLVRAADCPTSSTTHGVSTSAMTLSRNGPISDTVVSLPIGSLSSGNYAVRFKQANMQTVCAQLH